MFLIDSFLQPPSFIMEIIPIYTDSYSASIFSVTSLIILFINCNSYVVKRGDKVWPVARYGHVDGGYAKKYFAVIGVKGGHANRLEQIAFRKLGIIYRAFYSDRGIIRTRYTAYSRFLPDIV
jgi:hypothetical protein